VGVLLTSYETGTGAFSSELKWPKHENYKTPSSAVNAKNYTPHPLQKEHMTFNVAKFVTPAYLQNYK
jgi:hypothetical protein